MLHAQDLLDDPSGPTHRISVVLLGRVLSLISTDLLDLGPADFHLFLQRSLLDLLSRAESSPHLRSYLSIVISKFAAAYSKHNFWPELGASLLSFSAHSDPAIGAVALDCLAECLNNQSLNTQQIAAEIQALLSSRLVPHCPPSLLIPTLRLLYASKFASAAPLQIVRLIQRLDPVSFEVALCDLGRYFAECPSFVGGENVPEYLEFGMATAMSDGHPEGLRVCAIDLVVSLLLEYAELFANQIEQIVHWFSQMLCAGTPDVEREAADGIQRIAEVFGGRWSFRGPALRYFVRSGGALPLSFC
jgi:hypothetical protein